MREWRAPTPAAHAHVPRDGSRLPALRAYLGTLLGAAYTRDHMAEDLAALSAPVPVRTLYDLERGGRELPPPLRRSLLLLLAYALTTGHRPLPCASTRSTETGEG